MEVHRILQRGLLEQLYCADEAQILNYLALTKHRLGLLLNFGSKSLEHRRFVLDQ